MSINLTDEIEVKTKKGKLCAAKQIFLEGDTQTVEKEIQDINSRHNDLSSKHESLSSTVSEHTKQIESNQSQIAANKSAQDEKNTSLDANMAKLNTRDDQITELVKGVTATGGASVATAVTYDNTSSHLASATVQGAVDELQDSITELEEKQGIYNVDVNVPLSSGQFYTSTTAHSAVPTSIRKLGLIITYKTDATTSITEQFIGSSISDWGTDSNWKKVGSDGGNKILEWNTDVNTTRKSVPQKERKAGMQISYLSPTDGWINEQYVGKSFTDTEWVKNSNWVNFQSGKIPNTTKGKGLGLYPGNLDNLLNIDTSIKDRVYTGEFIDINSEPSVKAIFDVTGYNISIALRYANEDGVGLGTTYTPNCTKLKVVAIISHTASTPAFDNTTMMDLARNHIKIIINGVPQDLSSNEYRFSSSSIYDDKLGMYQNEINALINRNISVKEIELDLAQILNSAYYADKYVFRPQNDTKVTLPIPTDGLKKISVSENYSFDNGFILLDSKFEQIRTVSGLELTTFNSNEKYVVCNCNSDTVVNLTITDNFNYSFQRKTGEYLKGYKVTSDGIEINSTVKNWNTYRIFDCTKAIAFIYEVNKVDSMTTTIFLNENFNIINTISDNRIIAIPQNAKYVAISLRYTDVDAIPAIYVCGDCTFEYVKPNYFYLPDKFVLSEGICTSVYTPSFLYGKRWNDIFCEDRLDKWLIDIMSKDSIAIKIAESFNSIPIKKINKSSISYSSTRYVIPLGDSLTMNADWVNEFSRQLTGIGTSQGSVTEGVYAPMSLDIKVIGTLTDKIIKCEGRGGWRTNDYLTRSDNNPFFNKQTSTFDIDYYLKNNEHNLYIGDKKAVSSAYDAGVMTDGSNLDFIIFLGRNEQSNSFESIYNDFIKLIDLVKAKLMNVNVIFIGLPSTTINVTDILYDDYTYVTIKDTLVKQKICQERNYCHLFYIAPYLDPQSPNYTDDNIVIDYRSSSSIKRVNTDATHPKLNGQLRMADFIVLQYLDYLSSK